MTSLREKLHKALQAWNISDEHSDEENSQGDPCGAAVEGLRCCIDADHEQYEKMLDFVIKRLDGP